MNNCDKAYVEHLMELGHAKSLSNPMIDGFDAWYSSVLPQDKSATILDFGCGLGDFIEYLQKKGYSMIEGADSNPVICTAAAKRTSLSIEHLVDVETFALSRREKYDFINLKDVLEHVEPNEAVKVLLALKATLKREGVLIISCPQICGFTSIFTLYNDYTHLKLFTERSLKQLLRSAGFQDVMVIHPKPKFKFSLSYLALKTAQKIWFRILKIIYLIERPGEESPSYLGDRIAMIAVNQKECHENII